MIDLKDVGAYAIKEENQWRLTFGIYLPNISSDGNYQLQVRVIHIKDQFTPGIEPLDFDLEFIGGEYGLWKVQIPLQSQNHTGHFGDSGQYVYRYRLLHHQHIIVNWFADPFARASASGTSSMVAVEDDSSFEWSDDQFQVPHVNDMIVYELMTAEFNNDFFGIEQRLVYLKGLGVNVIELMPVTNMKENFRWGYMPLSFFAPEERYGGALALKQLINTCHQNGVAVIVDAVYAHAHQQFAYNHVYQLANEANPMMGNFAGEIFGIGTDFTKKFTRDYFLQVNQYWLDEFHIDGFRYDYVPGFYQSPIGPGYANLVFETYKYTVHNEIKRFIHQDTYSRIIQCAENLHDPKGILEKTYSNCAWQNETLGKSFDMAKYQYVDDSFVHHLCLIFKGYPTQYQHPDSIDRFPQNVFQYIETHDHSRLITQLGLSHEKDALGLSFGNRENWYKLQPFIIALYTCQGIPMLWNGQEFGENYSIPNSGNGRVFLPRPLHWEHFYDEEGKGLIRLYRKMAEIRQNHSSLRDNDSFYYNHASATGRKVVIYQRRSKLENNSTETCLVFLNFGMSEQRVQFKLPHVGTWHELLHGDTLQASEGSQSITIPSNYGRIFRIQF